MSDTNTTSQYPNLVPEEGEEWKDVEGWNGYKVSSHGRIYSKHSQKLMSQVTNRCTNGYANVTFREGQGPGKERRQTFRVHRVVAQNFLENPENKRCINHKDGDKLNNHLDNLEWATHSENNQHALDVGLRDRFHYTRNARAVYQIDEDNDVVATYESLGRAGEAVGIPWPKIHAICNNHPVEEVAGGYKWCYKEWLENLDPEKEDPFKSSIDLEAMENEDKV